MKAEFFESTTTTHTLRVQVPCQSSDDVYVGHVEICEGSGEASFSFDDLFRFSIQWEDFGTSPIESMSAIVKMFEFALEHLQQSPRNAHSLGGMIPEGMILRDAEGRVTGARLGEVHVTEHPTVSKEVTQCLRNLQTLLLLSRSPCKETIKVSEKLAKLLNVETTRQP